MGTRRRLRSLTRHAPKPSTETSTPRRLLNARRISALTRRSLTNSPLVSFLHASHLVLASLAGATATSLKAKSLSSTLRKSRRRSEQKGLCLPVQLRLIAQTGGLFTRVHTNSGNRRSASFLLALLVSLTSFIK